MLATMIKTDEADRIPDSAPGQVKILSDGVPRPAPTEIVDVVSRALGDVANGPADNPVVVRVLASNQSFAVLPGPTNGLLAAVGKPADLARISGQALSKRQRLTLLGGGVLQWSHPQRDALTVTLKAADGTSRPVGSIPTAAIALDPAWEGYYSGVMLERTATRLELPVVPGDAVFTGVSDSAARQAKAAVLDAGLDPYYVKVYQAPAGPQAPPVFYLALVALSAVVLFTVTFVVRAQATALRRLLGALTALGVPPRWARGVLLTQLAFAATIAEVLALVIAGPVVALTVSRLPGYELQIPWDWLAAVTMASVAAMALSGLVSTRRLTAADRTSV
jgi:hypothetical protein